MPRFSQPMQEVSSQENPNKPQFIWKYDELLQRKVRVYNTAWRKLAQARRHVAAAKVLLPSVRRRRRSPSLFALSASSSSLLSRLQCFFERDSLVPRACGRRTARNIVCSSSAYCTRSTIAGLLLFFCCC